MSNKHISIIKIKSDSDLNACLEIRKQVFIIGQDVPEEEEVDGLDNQALHFLLRYENTPAGTARVRLMEGSIAKVERVAILEQFQGKKLGRELMQFIISDLKTYAEVQTVTLGSQVHAAPFYEKLGFVAKGDEYMDANIPHRKMWMDLR